MTNAKETKFKYEDKVKVIGTDIVGELIDIIPVGFFMGRTIYKYKLFSITKGFMAVDENQIEKVTEDDKN